MLFRKKIEPRCSYCARGGRANDHEVICAKKGIVPAESHCGAFRYDPLKRVPPRPAKLETEELRQEVRRINRLLAGKARRRCFRAFCMRVRRYRRAGAGQ